MISGNDNNGISIWGPGTSSNVVAGNFIGTDRTGLTALGNGLAGIEIYNQAQSNLIGTSSTGGAFEADQRNVISGNTAGAGIEITGFGTQNNVVSGNYLGTNYTGTAALPNYAGVEIDSGASGNLVGTNGDGVNDALERNLLSGNLFAGVWMTGAGTDNNVVAGNYIGTDVTGTGSIGNGSEERVYGSFYVVGGVVIDFGTANNLIGTSGHSADDAGQRNIISGNLSDAVDFYGSGTSGNVVAGNFIGTNASGTAAVRTRVTVSFSGRRFEQLGRG